MRNISLWGIRIAPLILVVLLFIPGFLCPFGYTDTFFGAPQSVLSLSTMPDYIRTICDPIRDGYDYIKSIYTGASVAQTAVLSDLIPILCMAFFITYIAMALGTILTYFKSDTVQNFGARVIKIGGFFSLGVTLATYLVNYSLRFKVVAESGVIINGVNVPKDTYINSVQYGLSRAVPIGAILALVLILLSVVGAYIFNYINTQSIRAAMKILQSVRPVENPGKRTLKTVLCYIVASLIALVFLIPFYFTVLNSLRELNSMPTIRWPTPPHFENYVYAINRIPFGRFAISSIIIVVLSVGFGVVINYIFAYAFARLNAPGKDFLFSIVITLMMVPTIATQIPQYVVLIQMNTYNTYWIWFLLGLAGKPTYIFLYRQFLMGIPKALEESAKIDGASMPRTILSIIVPNTAPVIATVFMLEFLYSWGDVLLPFLYLDISIWPISGALQGTYYKYPNTSTTLEPLVMAMCILFIIPSVVAYTFGQKYLREGMITSGLKG